MWCLQMFSLLVQDHLKMLRWDFPIPPQSNPPGRFQFLLNRNRASNSSSNKTALPIPPQNSTSNFYSIKTPLPIQVPPQNSASNSSSGSSKPPIPSPSSPPSKSSESMPLAAGQFALARLLYFARTSPDAIFLQPSL